MYNKSLVLTIIVVVLLIVVTPFLYWRVSPGALLPPKPEPPPGGEKRCVESTDFMRKHHVDLLEEWRQSVVREGHVKYVASDGKEYDESYDDLYWLPFEQGQVLRPVPRLCPCKASLLDVPHVS
jgi:hypothetical protein